MSEPRDAPDGAAPPLGPTRREALTRIGSALLVGTAATLGAVAFYDRRKPVREHRERDRVVPSHAVELPAGTPRLVIARGKDPGRNVVAALERLGGMGRFVTREDVVLVKPNAGWDRTPEQAANTDPRVIAAVVRACREAGAKKVLVADCPVNNPESCFGRSGILEAATREGAQVVSPSRARHVMVTIPGKLGRWPVLEPFATATKVINVPVAKHHSLTRVTCGLKNWYGILGGRRARLHQRIDESIVELAALMKPTLTVVDATRLLMRNGPTGGSLADVKRGDALAISLDPVAADAWAASLLEADPQALAWLRLAEERKLGRVDYRVLNPLELTTG
ncbi:MAG: DUF362 domain-containing protein [Deltaproteobacteria bacterium]|nr:DUF362 domain-containing protein [Deltaproteobacteria bacterium]